MRPRTPRRATAVSVLGLALFAAPAGAHEKPVHSSPVPRAALPSGGAPRIVSLHFGEATAPSDVRMRVVGPGGERLDRGRPRRVGSGAIGVRLAAGAPDGGYTVGWRAVGADGHVAAGSFTFRVGAVAGARTANRAHSVTGAHTAPRTHAAAGTPAIDPIDLTDVPHATTLAFDLSRTGQYLALALAFGTMLFGMFAWRAAEAPSAVRRTVARRSRRLLLGALVLGATSAASAMICQAATHAGTTPWSADLPRGVLEGITGGAGCAWAVVLAGWLAALTCWSYRPGGLAAILLVSGLVLSPALCGHAAGSPLAPAVAIHVAAMATWTGGLVALMLVWRTAAEALSARERLPLLAATIARFSRLALPAACAVLATGAIQAIALLGAPADLLDSGYGRLVALKLLLFAALIALATRTRLRLQPRLRDVAPATAIDAARALRAAVGAEIALALVVLGATGALAGAAPPA